MKPREINVGIGEMKKGRNPDILLANLFPCTTVGVYHPET